MTRMTVGLTRPNLVSLGERLNRWEYYVPRALGLNKVNHLEDRRDSTSKGSTVTITVQPNEH